MSEKAFESVGVSGASRVARRLFEMGWRISVLVLPWQTRWFGEAKLGGWSWEQGRWSFYVTWLPMVLTMVAGVILLKKKMLFEKKWMCVVGLLLGASVARGMMTHEVIVSMVQWWVQVGVLVGFGWVVSQLVTRRQLLAWFIGSLVPVAVLGMMEYAQQFVWGAKYLGMAVQDPRTLGVSVVEHGEFRVLRAYGSFPHPNIFGAWLMVGIVACIELVKKLEEKFYVIVLALCSALFGVSLVVTYARSAWLGLLVGLVASLVVMWRNRVGGRFDVLNVQGVGMVVAAALLAIGVVGYSQLGHVLARTTQTTARLEVKSVDERKASLLAGWQTFLAQPMVGTGVNGELWFMARSRPADYAPTEPPHAVPVLALVNFGIVGFIGCLLLVWKKRHWWFAPLMVGLLPAFLLDHFLWSFWAGQTLVMICLLVTVLDGVREGQKQVED